MEALRARVDPLEALLLDRTLESLRMVAALALADQVKVFLGKTS